MKKPFLIYTGNLYPHKNVLILIEAAQKLKLDLAIVCARSVFESRLPKSKYVHFLGRVEDAELVKLYKQASCFVFPSLIEGFGLPGLEAMAVGLPVIAAQASCLPEIYGEAALYFDPYSLEDLVEKINTVMTDNKLCQDLISRGHQQVSKYSWSKMAEATWQIYQNELR
ncbi:MAG: glycosyltransferase family 1 protein [bacterium]|nr:glycosyltransferase family 1 protein [bacterium]